MLSKKDQEFFMRELKTSISKINDIEKLKIHRKEWQSFFELFGVDYGLRDEGYAYIDERIEFLEAIDEDDIMEGWHE